MTLRKRAKPEVPSLWPGDSIRVAKPGEITQQGLQCLHLKQKMELGEVVTGDNNVREDGVVTGCAEDLQRLSKVIKVSFLPKKEGMYRPSRGSEAQWCLQHTCLYQPKCKYGSWKSPERPQLDAGWGLVSPRTIRLVSAMISLESGINQW